MNPYQSPPAAKRVRSAWRWRLGLLLLADIASGLWMMFLVASGLALIMIKLAESGSYPGWLEATIASALVSPLLYIYARISWIVEADKHDHE